MSIGHFAVGFASKRAAPQASLGVLLAGTPPPTIQALAWTGVLPGSLMAVWAWWADRHGAAEPQ